MCGIILAITLSKKKTGEKFLGQESSPRKCLAHDSRVERSVGVIGLELFGAFSQTTQTAESFLIAIRNRIHLEFQESCNSLI